MGTGEFNAGGNPAMGSRNTSSRLMLQKPGIITGLMGRLARMQPLPFCYTVSFFFTFLYTGFKACAIGENSA